MKTILALWVLVERGLGRGYSSLFHKMWAERLLDYDPETRQMIEREVVHPLSYVKFTLDT